MVKPLLKGKLGQVLLPLFLVTIFVVVPLVSIGAIWVQHVALLPNTAVVFPSDAAAMDRFMAAALKPYYGDRIGICDGTNDHVEIQAALDAVNEVKLSEGTFYCEVQIDLNGGNTLRGCSQSTSILTTSTDNLVFLSVVDVNVVNIRDLYIEGASHSTCGIYLHNSSSCLIENVCSADNMVGGAYDAGIYVHDSDYNTIRGNLCTGNLVGIALVSECTDSLITENVCIMNTNQSIYLYTDCTYNIISNNRVIASVMGEGIYLYDGCHYNVIEGNTGLAHGSAFIKVRGSDWNTITGNIGFQSSGDGYYFYESDYNTITGNVAQLSQGYGMYLYDSNHNSITGNTLTENSQGLTNWRDNIYLSTSDYNIIQSNVCQAGTLAAVPRYGINLSWTDCDGNLVIDNDLSGGGWGTAAFNDAGTGTKLNVYVVPFVDGSDPQDSGFLIDANLEYARSYLRLPNQVTQVVRIKIYTRSVVAEADKMRGEFVIYGASDNENYQTHTGSIANHPSTSSNFAADDVIYWTITTAGVLALTGGDSIEVKVLHEAAGGADCATNAYFRTVEIEYVS